jgi:hypothetical protein
MNPSTPHSAICQPFGLAIAGVAGMLVLARHR